LANQNIWISNKDSQRLTEYVISAYQRLEEDFMGYLSYVPLREEYFQIHSQRLSDFILRTYQLQSTLFSIITFGEPMEFFLNRSVMHMSDDSDEKKEFLKKLGKLYNEKLNNCDNLISYYEIHNLNKVIVQEFWEGKCLSSKEIQLQEKLGMIEYKGVIKPFERKNWFAWITRRDMITHRGETEASLQLVLFGIACCAIILENIASNPLRGLTFNSNLFVIFKPQIRWG
jgi:hypothetical protein